MTDACWICESYQQNDFEWTPGESGPCNTKPMFIHF